jgi:Tfp pilus assembly protein PilX
MRQRQGGATLIIVLIMMGVIAFTSAAALRRASSNERVSNNFRMQALAQQYAEIALRYCEAQLALLSSARVATLQESNLYAFAGNDWPAWNQRGTWTGSGGASASLTSVPASYTVSASSSFSPGKAPHCVVEKLVLGSGQVYVVTARGFSPNYSADSLGFTASGAVVWLQSVAAIQREASSDPLVGGHLAVGTLADRSWRRIINTPLL